jgi:circadian clock protein KaiB
MVKIQKSHGGRPGTGKAAAAPAPPRGAKRAKPARSRPDAPDLATTLEFEKAIRQAGKGEHYVLRLYVTGSTPRSAAAITNIRKLCEEHLKGRYDLEVIDIYQQPVLAQGEQIIAAPTLIKKLPFPLRKVVGDLSNENRVLMGLDLQPRSSAS